MSDKRRPRDVLRTAFFSLWGLMTLVLVFTVGFLFLELVDQGDAQQLAGGTRRAAFPTGGPVDGEGSGTVLLYFADPVHVGLKPESRAIHLTDRTLENARAALQALVEGPYTEGAPVLPPTTKIRAMYLLNNGELVLDLGRDTETPALLSASAEWLMVQSIVRTLSQSALQGPQDRFVTKVRFLFEGSPPTKAFPRHISLLEPVAPSPTAMGRPTGTPADA